MPILHALLRTLASGPLPVFCCWQDGYPESARLYPDRCVVGGDRGTDGRLSRDMDTYILEIDPDPQLVPTARMFAATVARQLGCAEESVLDVKIAVSEACTNAVQAHVERNVPSPITLKVEEEASGLLYEVKDAGKGIDEIPAPPPEVFQRAVEEGPEDQGMGLALIRALFPAAEFLPQDEGTVVRFRIDR